MRIALILATTALLTACADAVPNAAASVPDPLSISKVSVEVDDASGAVDVELTVTNLHDASLKDLSIHLVPRNEAGELIPGAHLELKAARPIPAGATVGPVRVTADAQGQRIGCVELYHVRAALPDHSIVFVSGADTLRLVNGELSGLCASTSGEQAPI
jgi:hypothetical protein